MDARAVMGVGVVCSESGVELIDDTLRQAIHRAPTLACARSTVLRFRLELRPMSDELPSREEIERIASDRAKERQEATAEQDRVRRAAVETGVENAQLVREFVEKARASNLPLERVEVRGKRQLLRRRKSTVAEGWELADVPLLRTEARWLIRPTDPPSWWKITRHRSGNDEWETVESVPLHSNPGLIDPATWLLRGALTDKLVALEEARRNRR